MYANTNRNIHTEIAVTLFRKSDGKKLAETLVHSDRYSDAQDASNVMVERQMRLGVPLSQIVVDIEKV